MTDEQFEQLLAELKRIADALEADQDRIRLVKPSKDTVSL
jgi:hypothetical protein